MSDIGKGDWVLCVSGDDHIAAGNVYCVAEIVDGCGPCDVCGSRDPGIELVDQAVLADCLFCTCQFQPLGGQERIARKATKRQCEPA